MHIVKHMQEENLWKAFLQKIESINETLAKQGLEKIGKLFGIEKEIEVLKPEKKAKKIQEESKPILNVFFK